MDTPRERTPPLRWATLSLAAGALILTYVIEATDKKWFDTGSVGGTGVTYKTD
ncbi:MAG: hypothetical protein ACR2JG_11455 [Geodermatophilaceae bacterium]